MAMDIQVLDELKTLGTEQNRKIYRRHGVRDELYGVSYADLKKLVKKVKVDHTLARKLWASGVHDARLLATMVADPKQADDALLEAWAHDLSDYTTADALSGYAGRTPFVRAKAEQWTRADGEWIETVGWNLLAYLAMTDRTLPDRYFEDYLAAIERDIHAGKNRVRYAMNGALIAIGMRNPALEQKALAAAARIGKVEVDHGETSCKTPDAAAYIRKAGERKKAS
jgi:3-methyladenine DNA glycosylase AlkD